MRSRGRCCTARRENWKCLRFDDVLCLNLYICLSILALAVAAESVAVRPGERIGMLKVWWLFLCLNLPVRLSLLALCPSQQKALLYGQERELEMLKVWWLFVSEFVCSLVTARSVSVAAESVAVRERELEMLEVWWWFVWRCYLWICLFVHSFLCLSQQRALL